jgi:hypothetical protein
MALKLAEAVQSGVMAALLDAVASGRPADLVRPDSALQFLVELQCDSVERGDERAGRSAAADSEWPFSARSPGDSERLFSARLPNDLVPWAELFLPVRELQWLPLPFADAANNPSELVPQLRDWDWWPGGHGPWVPRSETESSWLPLCDSPLQRAVARRPRARSPQRWRETE